MKTKWCASHMSIQIKAAFHIIQFSMIDFYRRFDWFLFCQTYRVAWWSRIFSCSFVIPKLHELKFWFRIPLDIFWDLLQRAVGKLTRATNDIHTKQKTLFDNVYQAHSEASSAVYFYDIFCVRSMFIQMHQHTKRHCEIDKKMENRDNVSRNTYHLAYLFGCTSNDSMLCIC